MEQGDKFSRGARRNTVRKDIQEAEDRNENQIESEDTKGKKKWFGLVPNCFLQYNRGKDLEDKKQRIQQLVGLFWRILGFVSSIIAFTCFALSPSFYDLFGRWNLLKNAIYGVVSLILTTSTLLIKKCPRFTRSVLMKANVGFLVMMLTSLCSIWQDRVSEKVNDEKGSRGRILNMCSFGAFGLMSLSLSRQLELGFEVGVFNFLLGSFLVLLMKMNFKLAPLAAILCYVIINIRSFSDFLMEKLGRANSSDTVLPEDIESGSRNGPEHSLHQGISDTSDRVACSTVSLKDRKLKYGKLTEALKDDNKFAIGLYGLGGTGKTTMAIEVGKEVAESKVFDKVIFCVVSRDANLKKIREDIVKHLNFLLKEGTDEQAQEFWKRIRGNIAKYLNFPLNEGTDESEQAQELWKRIVEGGEKVLIILDDVWQKLSLEKIGIPLGRHGKSCCSMLLTTRDQRVCLDMGCDEIIELEVLSEKDAVDLFLSYAGQSIHDSSNDFKDVALDIVKECGRLPVAVVAVGKALNSRPLIEWKEGLERLRNFELICNVDEHYKAAYNSLRLSYDYLKNEEAKKILLEEARKLLL